MNKRAMIGIPAMIAIGIGVAIAMRSGSEVKRPAPAPPVAREQTAPRQPVQPHSQMPTEGRVPAHFETPPHSHDHSEVFVVLEGSCVFDGAPMGRHDSTVVEANDKYGFTTGADCVALLVVRTGAAAVSM